MVHWSTYLNEHQDQILADFLAFLRIPSISTDPAFAADVRRAAEWTANHMEQIGLEAVQVMETSGHPIVYGEWLHAPGRPTVLFYAHVDVQPGAPLARWTSPPFEPEIRDGRVYARGATDTKGNLLLPLIACAAHLRTTGKLPLNVKFLFEGEEEVLSPSLAQFVGEHRDLLACDLAVSADSLQYSEEQPALVVGLRGCCGLQINVRSASSDLHSGRLGGVAPNAIHALVQILESMRGPDGKVLVDGFYEDVIALSPVDRQRMTLVPDDTAAIIQQTGIKAVVHEPGFTPRESNWARPTLEVNGIRGGFQGEGVKTIIPAEAFAKVTCRLVPDQDPDQIVKLLQAHILRHAPAEVDVSISVNPGQGDPYLIPVDHPGMVAAERVLCSLYGREPYHIRMGSTIPVTAVLRKLLGIYTVQFGFSMTDERAHAPNEFLRLSSFARGQRAFCMLMEELDRQVAAP